MDWAVLMDILIGIAGVLGIGALAVKIRNDGQRFKNAMLAVKASLTKMWAEIVAANADKNVTQEEFDKIVVAASAFMKDFDELITSGTVIVDDLYALRDAIEAMVKTWQGKAAARAAAAHQ